MPKLVQEQKRLEALTEVETKLETIKTIDQLIEGGRERIQARLYHRKGEAVI